MNCLFSLKVALEIPLAAGTIGKETYTHIHMYTHFKASTSIMIAMSVFTQILK